MMNMLASNEIKLIGIDLGGTNVNVGLVKGNKIIDRNCKKVPFQSSNQWDIINLIIDMVADILSRNQDVSAIGVGVPSILDRELGIIHEVQNIPSWKEVPLADILISKFGIPVFLDNDANCFALGEYQFGNRPKVKNMVGLTIGTGLGTGIITNGSLLCDANGGAGEFGMIPYKDGIIEDYCSGKFFKKFYNMRGEELVKLAANGNVDAIEGFEKFGEHLGNAINIIMYAIDPQRIIIGGSVVKSAKYFDTGLRKIVRKFAYRKTLEKIEIIYSDTPGIAVLGAASLYYDREPLLNKDYR